MTLIRFTQDFRGKLTAEQFYQAGDVAEFSSDVAAQIVALGRAEHVLFESIPEVLTPTPDSPKPETERPAPKSRKANDEIKNKTPKRHN